MHSRNETQKWNESRTFTSIIQRAKVSQLKKRKRSNSWIINAGAWSISNSCYCRIKASANLSGNSGEPVPLFHFIGAANCACNPARFGRSRFISINVNIVLVDSTKEPATPARSSDAVATKKKNKKMQTSRRRILPFRYLQLIPRIENKTRTMRDGVLFDKAQVARCEIARWNTDVQDQILRANNTNFPTNARSQLFFQCARRDDRIPIRSCDFCLIVCANHTNVIVRSLLALEK